MGKVECRMEKKNKSQDNGRAKTEKKKKKLVAKVVSVRKKRTAGTRAVQLEGQCGMWTGEFREGSGLGQCLL